MSRPKRTKEEEILHLEKKIRKLREEPETTITINGEYKSRGSGSSQRENGQRSNSTEDLSPLSPIPESELQARSEPPPRLDATDSRDHRQTSNVVKPQNARREPRAGLNPVAVNCPDLEPGEIVSSAEERNSRTEQRTNRINSHTAEVSGSKVRSRELFEVQTPVSRNKLRENSSTGESRTLISEPRRNSNVEDANNSRNESRATSSSVEPPRRRISKVNAAGHSSRSEPVNNLTEQNLDTSEAETPHRPEAHSRNARVNSDTPEVRTPRDTSGRNSDTSDDNSEANNLLDRKAALIKALGDDLSLSGELIHSTLVQPWSTILKKGLSNDIKEKLLKEYFAPENCKMLKAPVLNDEVAAVVECQARNRDKILETKQNQLGLGITAIGRAITVLINREDNYEINAMQHLNHGCRMLLDLHYTETKSRRFLFKKDLIRSDVFKKLSIHTLERDDTLFGNKVTRMVKKQGIPMTPIHQRPSSSLYEEAFGPPNRGRDTESFRYRRN